MCPILVRTVEILHKTSSAVFTSLATHACSTDTPVLGLLMSKELERTRSSGLLFFPFPSKSPLIRLGWPREVTWVRKDRTGFWAVHKGPLPSACAQSKLWSVGKVCSWWLSHRCHVFSWSCWTPRTHGVSTCCAHQAGWRVYENEARNGGPTAGCLLCSCTCFTVPSTSLTKHKFKTEIEELPDSNSKALNSPGGSSSGWSLLGAGPFWGWGFWRQGLWDEAFWGRGLLGARPGREAVPLQAGLCATGRLVQSEAAPMSPSAPFPQGPLGFGDWRQN